ncbi:MAG: cupin domain-containing protein [Bacteroidales bacterium]
MKETINVYNDSHWEDASEYPSGTKKMVLRDEKGAKTILLKLPEGFYMAPHSHVTTEQHFLIDGEYISEGKTFLSGTYQKFDAHETHGPFESKKGALILVVWDPYQSH